MVTDMPMHAAHHVRLRAPSERHASGQGAGAQARPACRCSWRMCGAGRATATFSRARGACSTRPT